MRLEDFGYNDLLEKFRIENNLSDYKIGRVVSVHKDRYSVITEMGELEAEPTGNFRFSVNNPEDFPAVGDWVALSVYDSGHSLVHKVLPRSSIIARQMVSQSTEKQIIATNIDHALLLQAADRDFNINRLERYLTICNAAKVSPIIVLTKIDLIDKNSVSELLNSIKTRIKNVPVIAISNSSKEGYDKIKAIIEKGKTYCMLGSSGAGKSSLLNNLSGKNIMQTNSISRSTDKGRHTTSHRQLIILENGGILIDNPGMREVGITDTKNGLEQTFDSIFRLSKSCWFNDCTHTSEIGCSVLKALENGEINKASYENYLKMEKEKAHFESSVLEKRRKDKAFGKMMKKYRKDIQTNK